MRVRFWRFETLALLRSYQGKTYGNSERLREHFAQQWRLWSVVVGSFCKACSCRDEVTYISYVGRIWQRLSTALSKHQNLLPACLYLSILRSYTHRLAHLETRYIARTEILKSLILSSNTATPFERPLCENQPCANLVRRLCWPTVGIAVL